MATIRDKPGHIAASDSSRTSYKPPFLRWWVTEEKFGPLHSIQAIENEGHIEMRVGQVCRQSLQMAHFIANRCHIPTGSVQVERLIIATNAQIGQRQGRRSVVAVG